MSNLLDITLQLGPRYTIEVTEPNKLGFSIGVGARTETGIGPQGPQGIQGIQGPSGSEWVGAWITATAYTVGQTIEINGSSYTCILDHTAGVFATDLLALKWDLVVSKGDIGSTGIQGIQGVQGDKGDTGDTGADSVVAGPQGIQGIQGVKGDTGDQGIQGNVGATGDGFTGGSYAPGTGIITFTSDDGIGFSTSDLRGATGSQGVQGNTGAGFTGGTYSGVTGIVTFTSGDGLGFVTGDLRGAQGIQGIQGNQGDQGIQGVQGVIGVTGNGFTGGSYGVGTGIVTFTSSDGLGFVTGDLRGAKGDTGDQGIQGIIGLTGDQGIQGIAGFTVLNGTVVPVSQGVNGDFFIRTDTSEIYGPKSGGSWGSATSLIGPQGIQGIQGEVGPTGAGTGDMLISTYDPNTVNGDAFSMDNMVEGALTKILTNAERTAISNNTAKVSNVVHPLVETAVPLGAVFTDNDTIYDDSALTTLVNGKQSQLPAQDLIDIGNLSGTNTGDQTIPASGVDFDPVGTDNSDNNAVNTLYSGLVTNATHTGDVTGSGALTIATGAVTLAKMANMATASLMGRNTAGTGVPEVLSKATTLALLNVEDGATADQTGAQIKTAYEGETGHSLDNITLTGGVTEDQYSLTGTVLEPANGTVQYKTLASNTTFTEALADGESILLAIDDGTAYTITWPTITWVTDAATAPTLETTGYTFIVIWHMNAVLYGAKVNS